MEVFPIGPGVKVYHRNLFRRGERQSAENVDSLDASDGGDFEWFRTNFISFLLLRLRENPPRKENERKKVLIYEYKYN